MPKKAERFDHELMYGYWKEAGGTIAQAMRLAKDGGDKDRVPGHKQTWAKIAAQHTFNERMRGESKTDWQQYHAERQANVQQTLDKMAEGFEMLAGAFLQMFEREFKIMREGGELGPESMRRLLRFFGSMESIDRYFRMYLRSQGLPERITKVDATVTPVMKYDDLESNPPPKTLEEAKRMAAEGE